MGKYDDAIGGGELILDVVEVLNEAAANKVDKRIKEQKAELEKPIEVNIKTDAAANQLKELTKAAKKIKEDLNNAMSSGKEFKDLHKAVSEYEKINKQIKQLAPAVDKNNSALKEGNKVLRDTKKLVDQLMGVEKKPRKTKSKTSVQQEVEATKNLIGAAENVGKAQEKAAQTTLRTQKQVNAELDKELQKLKDIEVQQAKNNSAREKLKRDRANYGKEFLGTDRAVYDTDLLKGARKELQELNQMLEIRNKFQEKYIKLCNIISNYYVDDKPGKHSIGNNLYKNLDAFFLANSDISWLESLNEKGQKTTNKTINESFKNIIRGLQADINTVSSLIRSGEVVGDMVGQNLDREESQLNKEMQELLEAREAQLKKINALRQEELDLIKKAGQEEAKNVEVQNKNIKNKEARLKLTPKKEGNHTVPETYTALDGKYEVSKGKNGWDVLQRDNIGKWNLIGTYKTLNDVRSDASLLTREEIVVTSDVAKEVETLAAAYEDMSTRANRSMKFAEQYTKMFDKVRSGALSAADAIKQLNETIGSSPSKKKTATVESKVEVDTFVDKAKLEGRIKDLKYMISNQEAWLKYLDRSLNQNNFKRSGKREAASQLRSLTQSLVLHRHNNYESYNGEYAKEMVEVAWMHGYQEAIKQGVAESTLSRYNTDAKYFYDDNLKKLQDEYNYRQKILNESQVELRAIEAQIAAANELQVGTLDHLVNSLNQLDSISPDPLNKIIESIVNGEEKISAEVQQILQDLNLLNDAGQFSGNFITEGMNNSGVVTNGKYAIVARGQEVYDQYDDYDFNFKEGTTYLDNLITKEKEAATQGVNLARVLDVVKTKSTSGGDLFYEIQEFVPGEQLHVFDAEKKSLQGFEQECKRIVGATDEQIQQLMSDIIKLNELGFFIDFSPANILYDTTEGFKLIDLELRDLGTSAQTTTELMEGLYVCLMGLEDSAGRVDLTMQDADKWGTSMASVYERLNQAFAQNSFGIDVGDATSRFGDDFRKYISQPDNQIDANKKLQSSYEDLTETIEQTANAKKELLDNKGSSDVSVEEIVKRDVEEALAQLRSAKNNETTLFSLKGVFEGDDLVDQAQAMIKNIAEQANLALSSFNVKDDTIKVKLYNDELKITVDQMYKLRQATEEMDSAQLELVSQSFSQNVKALNENKFDTEGIQQRALASIEKVRSSLHGLEYDLTDLENAARNISSQDDFVKFNNQLKAAQDNIQAIKNSTVSKNSMNPLANMQRDMQNASIEIETMRLKLEKFGDIQGVAEAKKMLSDMAEAAKQYNSATDAQGQQGAYNQYSNLRSSFKAQTEYINAVKALNASQESAAKQTDPVKDQYKSVLDLVNKINTANERMIKFQKMDGGSGLLGKQMQTEIDKKATAIEKLNAVMSELKIGDVLGKDQYTISDDIQSIGTDYSQIAAFINDAGVQASLTTAEIEKLVSALVKAGDIDLSMLDEALNAGSIKERAKQVQKESQYFSDKTKFTDTLNIDDIQKLGSVGSTTKETLEGLAQTIAKNSDGAVALTKNFSQSADGIARLDFSVFDKSVGSLRDFRIELGTATGQIGVYETTINKSLANIQAAQKQLQSVGSLIGRLGASGVNVGEGSAPTQVAKLLEMYKQLSAEISKGDGADQNKITKLTKDLKLASSETEKFYKQMIQMEDAIVSGKAKDLGVGNLKGDVYGQLVKATKELVGTNQNATLEFGRFDAATNTLNASLVHANGTVENFQVQMNGLNGQMVAQQSGVTKLTTSWDRFKASMSKAGKQLVTAFAGYNVFYKAISEVRKGIGYVKEIDLALTELKKVTDETEESYRKFLNTAAGTAGEIGSTVSDFTEATANFARLGYTMSESAEMAKTAIVYKNVADGLDTVEESTDSIISTMKAFGIESDNTMQIIDIFNEVGNNFAITSAGIGEAMQRSASALYSAGNSIEESTALITAANSVIQNPEQVGTALKTLALRLRGAKVELEEAGLETDNMAESTSTLQAKLKALTHGKVDIMLDADTFKNTTQILREMSEAWEDMTDIERAAALELMGGKRQSNILASVITNFETVEDVIETSMNSSGSAMAENAKWMDSIEGKSQQLTNAMQALWNNTLNSDVIKFFLDVALGATELVDTIGVLPSALGAVLVYFTAFKKQSPGALFKDMYLNMQNYQQALYKLNTLNKLNLNLGTTGNFNAGAVNAYAAAVSNLTAKKQAELLATSGLNKAQIEEVMSRNQVDQAVIQETLSKTNLANSTKVLHAVTVKEAVASQLSADTTKEQVVADFLAANGKKKLTAEILAQMVQQGILTQEQAANIASSYALAGANNVLGASFKAVGLAMKTMFMSNPIGWIMMLISGVTMLTSKLKEAQEETDRVAKQAVSTYKDSQKTLQDHKKTIEDISGDYEKLSVGVDEFGNNVSLSTAQYERYNEIVNQIADMFPEMVRGYTTEGNAIIKNKGSVEALTEAYKSLQSEMHNTLLTNADDIMKSYQQTVNGTFWQWDFSTPDSIEAARKLEEILNNQDTFDFSQFNAQYRDKVYDNIPGLLEDAGIKRESNEKNDEFVKRAVSNFPGIVQSIINTWESTVNSAVSNVKPLISAYLEQSVGYSELNSKQKSMVDSITSSLDESFISQFDGDSSKMYQAIENMILDIKNSGIDKEYTMTLNAKTAFNGNEISVGEYRQQIDNFTSELDRLKDEGFLNNDEVTYIKASLEIDEDSLQTSINHVKSLLANTDISNPMLPDMAEKIMSLSAEDLKIASQLEVPEGTLYSWEELIQKINEVKKTAGSDVIPVQTYSSIIESVEKINEIEKQTAEIIVNNTSVTQEYKDSLVELGVSVDDLNECFYENNPLVVKNADALNKLVKNTKNNAAQNARLAKSQAGLQYYELAKEMSSYIDFAGKVADGRAEEIIALNEEMNALEKVIAQYSRLEVELLGVSNAYEKFAQAQELDEATDYTDDVESMTLALGEAFNTAELGTETAQAAIAGLVPPSVYEDLDTVDEKMDAIYSYYRNGKLSQYFTLEFDDEGTITNVEMKLGNLRKFIEDGLWGDNNKDGINVFSGSDWKNFEFSDKFLQELESFDTAGEKLQYFADQMGVTKEVAFAFIESLNDHDIEWLGGDYGSMFDMLTQSLEGNILKNTQSMAELNAQLAGGKISVKEWQNSMYGLKGQLLNNTISQEQYNTKVAELDQLYANGKITLMQYTEAIGGYQAANQALSEQAKNDALAWYEKTQQLEACNTQLNEYYDMLASGVDGDGNPIDEVTEEAIRESVEVIEGEINTLQEDLKTLEEPTQLTIELALDHIEKELDTLEKKIEKAGIDLNKAIAQNSDGTYTVTTEFEGNADLEAYVALLNERHTLEIQLGEGADDVVQTFSDINQTLSDIKILLSGAYKLKVEDGEAVSTVTSFEDRLKSLFGRTYTLSVNVFSRLLNSLGLGDAEAEVNGTANVSGTAHAKGTAYKTGNWGLSTNEHNALVGELGPELVVDPQSGRYYTVGDNGAEMVNLKRGSIIFNHVQTRGLLENGHITSRGKAYAEGNAHVTIYPNYSSQNQWTGTGYSGPNSDYNLSDTLSQSKEASDEFEETLDWIEIRLEEINEQLDLMSAKIENAGTYAEKNNIIDQMIGTNKNKMQNLTAGIKKYSDYAAKLLADVPAKYREAAQDGAISITEFAGEADEKTVEAIENYREWAQKVADSNQQLEETKTEIRDLAMQKFENVQEAGEVRATVEDSQTEKLQNAVDFDEERGLIADATHYAAMMENSFKKIEYLTSTRNNMQKELDDAVKSGKIARYSNEWYELVNQMYEIDNAIGEANIELEEFQNAINDIYWDAFDEAIDRLDYISDETQGLIDVMSSADMFSTPDLEDGWGEDDVKWTKEGLATLGLHAQEMERAEAKAQMYADAIEDLTAEYQAGHYSEAEYNEKLNELTEGQFDAIEAAEKEKKAIVDLQKARIEEVKKGIEKQIDAYEKLIEKQKESLDAEKDAHDFQRSIQDSQKNIADIERRIAALANDNSASAIAQRKQLEAELAEAKVSQEDLYYDRSIQNKQDALDEELESFKEEKDAEIEDLEEYLDDVEQIVTDSLQIVRDNATAIGQTLTDKTEEYSLTVSSAVLDPWRDGALAIDEYTTKFGDSVSSTTSQLETIRSKWQEIKEETRAANVEADKYYTAGTADGKSVSDIYAENERYIAATKTTTQTSSSSSSSSSSNSSSSASKSAPNVGSTVKVKTTATHFGSKSNGARMASFVPGGSYTVYQTSGSGNNMQVLIGRNGSYTGWVKLTDLQGYSSGTKGVQKDQFAWIDELGEELVMHADGSGKLAFLSKGSSVVPHDITENLMEIGQLNPSEILERNRPAITAPHITNTEINIDMHIAEVVHIDNVTNDTIPDLTKTINKQMESYMGKLNNSLKKYVR